MISLKVFLISLLVLLSTIVSCQGEGICKDVTISNCDLEDGLLIDSLDALDLIMCQDLCHRFSNCYFFRFEKSSSEENCQLFESSYRKSCKIVAAPVHRDVNECLTSTDETCDTILPETCDYLGSEIYTTPPGSILDSNTCDELCIDYERLDCSYWQYNRDEKQCTLYDSTESECSFISGPERPSIESCIENLSTVTSAATTTSISTSTKTSTTSSTTTTTAITTTSSHDTVIVTSDGLTDASPHCSYANYCEYTTATKNECADALCKAQGFTGGKFLSSSNNFCTESFAPGYCYVYVLDEGDIEYQTWFYEASITAECQLGI